MTDYYDDDWAPEQDDATLTRRCPWVATTDGRYLFGATGDLHDDLLIEHGLTMDDVNALGHIGTGGYAEQLRPMGHDFEDAAQDAYDAQRFEEHRASDDWAPTVHLPDQYEYKFIRHLPSGQMYFKCVRPESYTNHDQMIQAHYGPAQDWSWDDWSTGYASVWQNALDEPTWDMRQYQHPEDPVLRDYALQQLRERHPEVDWDWQQGTQEGPSEATGSPSSPRSAQLDLGDLPLHLGGKKTADFQGWSNWDTWNTKLMIDNERETWQEPQPQVEMDKPGDLTIPNEWISKIAMPYSDNTWYHVTDRRKLPQIAREGLVGSERGTDRVWGEFPVEHNAVYLWPNANLAHAYATESEGRWGYPTVLRIKGIDRNNIAPDHEGLQDAMYDLSQRFDEAEPWEQELNTWYQNHLRTDPLPAQDYGSFKSYPDQRKKEFEHSIRALRAMPAHLRNELARYQTQNSGDAAMHYGPISPHQIEVGHLNLADENLEYQDAFHEAHPEWSRGPEEDDDEDDWYARHDEALDNWMGQQGQWATPEEVNDWQERGLDDPEDDTTANYFRWTPLAEHVQREFYSKTAAPEDWGPLRVQQLAEPYEFRMPVEVEQRFLDAYQCPECKGHLRQGDGGLYCEYCGWRPRIAAAPGDLAERATFVARLMRKYLTEGQSWGHIAQTAQAFIMRQWPDTTPEQIGQIMRSAASLAQTGREPSIEDMGQHVTIPQADQFAWGGEMGNDPRYSMGQNGDLPAGLTFNVAENEEMVAGGVTCFASVPGEEGIGSLTIEDDGRIAGVEVEPAYRRMGIATAMLNHLRELGYNVRHDWGGMSADGLGWARTDKTANDEWAPAFLGNDEENPEETDFYKQRRPWVMQHGAPQAYIGQPGEFHPYPLPDHSWFGEIWEDTSPATFKVIGGPRMMSVHDLPDEQWQAERARALAEAQRAYFQMQDKPEQRTAMALTPEQLQQWISQYGPYAYHHTSPIDVDSILREGIKPSEDDLLDMGLGQTQRPGHAYLWTPKDWDNPNRQPWQHDPLRVDLRKLDPSLMMFDEDNMEAHPDWEPRGMDDWDRVAPFIEEHPDIDSPENVWRSMNSGSIAYRGLVPPDAVEKNPVWWAHEPNVQKHEEAVADHRQYEKQLEDHAREYEMDQARLNAGGIVGNLGEHHWDANGNVYVRGTQNNWVKVPNPPYEVDDAMYTNGIESPWRQKMQKLYPQHFAADFVPGNEGHWVWLDGQVGFGGEHHEIARSLASRLGYDTTQTNYISNLIARNAVPDGHAVAMGTMRGGYPQIWNSTRDRNAVWDDVARAHEQGFSKTAGLLEDAHRAYDSLINTGGFSLTQSLAAADGAAYFTSVRGYETTMPLDAFSPQSILSYRRSVLPELQSDPSFMLGGWLDGNTVYLDLSRSFQSEHEAVEFGRANGQLAVWDGFNNREIRLDGMGEDELREARIKKLGKSLMWAAPIYTTRLATWDGMPFDEVTGQRPNERDTEPERTPSGDFVFYHGTSPEGAQSIMQSHTLRPDDIGSVGISTTWGQAQVFAAMKRGPILRLVIPAAFFSSGQAIVKREIGGSGRNQFLITGADHMPITVPLLDVQVFDPDAGL